MFDMKSKTLISLLIPIVLCSCSKSIPLGFVTHTFNDVFLPTTNTQYYSSISLPKEARFYGSSNDDNIDSLAKLVSSHNGSVVLDSYSNSEEPIDVPLLVVPFAFKDNKSSEEERKQKTILLQNAFFGNKKTTTYESVASYYEKSSYGHIHITGEVLPWYQTSSYTIQEAIEACTNDSLDASYISGLFAKEVISYLRDSGFDLSLYTKNNMVRGLYLVYDYPQEFTNKEVSLLWAYVDRVIDTSKAPYASTYAWSSIGFLGDKAFKTNRVDTFTFIHETGHLLGLSDYYNINQPEKGYQPTGLFDMMDYNLGDHSSFSKYLLNWTTPQVALPTEKKTTTYTLRSFSDTGDCLLIPIIDENRNVLFNNSPFDEYLLLDYFTPNGLNDCSSFSSYSYFDLKGNKRVFMFPNIHGLRIYHIDARLGYFSAQNGLSTYGYIDDKDIVEKTAKASKLFVGFMANNSPVSINDNILCHLLSKDGNEDFKNGIAASNKTLFTFDDSFGLESDKWNDFTFNRHQLSCFYTIKIEKMRAKSIAISLTQK